MKRAIKKRPKIKELSNGDYVLVRGVSPILIEQVMASVQDPPVPTTKLSDGEDYPNPNDPEYMRQMAITQSTRERRSLHSIVFFGMTLCDEEGVAIEPPDNGWEFRLRMAGVDWKKEIEGVAGKLDEDELKFAKSSAYLMFIAISADDMPEVMKLAGVDEEEQRKAAATFQRSEE